MAEYDTISKHLIQPHPKDFIRLIYGQDDVEVLDILNTEQNTKVDFLGRLMILSGLEYDPILINRILLQEGLMDAIMRESSFAQYIKQLGIEQGREEGIEQGGRQRAVEDILEVLEIRFDLRHTLYLLALPRLTICNA